MLSSRTGQLDALKLPRGTSKVLCQAFSITETSQHVRGIWPQASDAWIEQFHSLSQGVPRVQNYAVEAARGNQASALEALRPNGKGLNDVLKVQFEKALQKTGNEDLFDRLIASLAVLRPPIPADHLAASAGTMTAVVNDLVNDLLPGLRVEDGGVVVADIDFEDFIKSSAPPETLRKVRATVAERFLKLHGSDSYAATHLADALVNAERGIELLQLIESETNLDAIADPIVRREVLLRRLQLALTVCERAKSATDTFKVVLIAADANRDEEVLRNLLVENVNLAVRFAWSTLRRLVLTNRRSVGSQGTVLAQDSARAARSGDRFTTRERLVSHERWLEQRRGVTEHERQLWKVSEDDIVARTEAIFELQGAEAAFVNLRRWRPRKVAIATALPLISKLLARGKREVLFDTFRKRLLPKPWDLLLAVPLAAAGSQIDSAAVEESLARLRKHHVPDVQRPPSMGKTGWEQWGFDLFLTGCEFATSLGVNNSVIRTALQIVRDKLPTKLFAHNPIAIDAIVRIWSLEQHLNSEELSMEALLQAVAPEPPLKKPSGKNRPQPRTIRDDSLEELRAAVRALFPVYEARLSLITGENRFSSDRAEVEPPNIDSSVYSFERNFWSNDLRAAAAASIMQLMVLPCVPSQYLFNWAAKVVQGKHPNVFGARLRPLLEQLSRRQSEHALVHQTVIRKTELIQHVRSASSDRADSLISFSRLLLPIAPDDSRELFAKAVELTKEMDREAFDQIELLGSLCKACPQLSEEKRGEGARDLFRFISSAAERLSNYDEFPWKATAVSLARISVSVGLASLARWADDGTAGLHLTLAAFVTEALRQRTLTPAVAASLALLIPPNRDLTKEILGAVNGTETRLSTADELARDCLLESPQDYRLEMGGQIFSVVPKESVGGLQNLSLLASMVTFLEDHERRQANPPTTEQTKSSLPVSGIDPAALVAEQRRSFATQDDVREVLDKARAASANPPTRELLMRMRESVQLSDRIAFLDAIAEGEFALVNESERAVALLDALNTWKDSPSVQRWSHERLEAVILMRFAGLSRWLKYDDFSLRELLEATGRSDDRLLDIITKGTEASGLVLGSRSLYGLSELMLRYLPTSEAAILFEWYLARLVHRIPRDEGQTLDVGDIPHDASEATGRFIFALLGDIDTRVRWRTAHALRRIARLGAKDVLDAVVLQWNRTQDTSFREPSAPFYFAASNLWLAMTLHRIANETPDMVAPHLKTLIHWATDKGFPHVLIREHAKRTIRTLIARNHVRLTKKDTNRIKKVNKSAFRRISTRIGNLNTHSPDRSERAFTFDSMDTVPYWYKALLRIFPKISMAEVLDRAENWIVDRWKAPATASWWDNEPRKARYDEGRFDLWSHRHGELPTIERYGTYLEWNAMFCVAGKLLETHALSRGDERGDDLEGWLERVMPTWPDLWIADCREPTPLDSQLWFADSRKESVWLRSARADEFLREMGLTMNGSSQWIVVGGDYTCDFTTRSSSVTVSSALVSSSTGSALVRALQTAHDPHDFRIPPEDDDLQIQQNPYCLVGWLASPRCELGIDEHDPMRNDVRPLSDAPGKTLIKTLDLKKVIGTRTSWVKSKNTEPALRGEIWSDRPQRDTQRYFRETGTTGSRLWMRVSDLQTFLNLEDLDLICEVQTDRRIHGEYSRPYDSDPKKNKTTHRIFLFCKNGRIEGAQGHLGTWAADRQRSSLGTGRRHAGTMDGASRG